MAFGNRRESLSIINKKMTVRNKGFVNSSLRVEKARGNKPIDRQHSIFGAIEKPRSTGFVEQERGEPMERTRVASLFARGGSKKKAVKPGMRLKPSMNVQSTDDVTIKAGNDAHRTIIFLNMMKREGKPFIIRKKYKKIRKGIYKYQRGRLNKIHELEPVRRKPKRVRWLSGGHKNYIKSADMRRVWGKAIEMQLRRKG